MGRARVVGPLVLLVALLAGCSKKRDAGEGAPTTSPRMTPSRAPTGDGVSMQTARTLGTGKSAEGKLATAVPFWLTLFPGPLEGQVKLELKVPKDAPRACMALSARDASGNVLSTLTTVCSDDPTKYSEGTAKLGRDAVYLTIESRDERATMGALYRVTLVAG